MPGLDRMLFAQNTLATQIAILLPTSTMFRSWYVFATSTIFKVAHRNSLIQVSL